MPEGAKTEPLPDPGAQRVSGAQRPVGHGPPSDRATGEPLVSLHGVTLGYEATVVLRGANCVIQRGEFIGVVGPSGSGKTSLLRAILGQVDIFAGEVELHSDARQRPTRIGYVPQVETVDWNFPITVEQIVLQGRWREMGWRPWAGRQDKALVAQVLERLGIADLRKRSIRALSGGQQQRAFLARALIGDPDLLLLDEPTSGVDIKTRHEVMHLLGELNRAGTSILLTTHDLNAVASHLPRLIALGDNAIIADGPPDAVLTPSVLRQAYGAEMLVLRRGRRLYVVEHPDDEPDLSGGFDPLREEVLQIAEPPASAPEPERA
ncbi:MAG: metal ABC transporter ATP-binding protein [Chloroflexi bacterium]|nr:metal ABC transporter ATP-binding protein [Chloroflexota bacterium]